MIVYLNSVLEEAGRLGREFGERGGFVGFLQSVPVVVREQFEAASIPATFGSAAFGDMWRARTPQLQEGFVRLDHHPDKTNLPERTSFSCFSFAAGEVKNHWELERGRGGSSGVGACDRRFWIVDWLVWVRCDRRACLIIFKCSE